MRLCHDRDNGRQVYVVDLFELRVRITGITGGRLPAAVGGQIFQSDVVDLHQGGLRARLHTEVADRDAVAHREGGHAGTGKFHSVIVGAVGANLPDDGQDQVARRRPVPQLSGEIEAQSLGHQDPGLAGHHAVEIIRASDAGAEGTQSPVGAGVAVRAEDQLAGHHVVFDHHLMTYTGALIEGDPVFLCEIAHFFLRSSGLWAVAGNVVVHDPDKLADIGDLRVFQVVVHIDRQMSGPVVAHEVVELDRVDVVRMCLTDSGGSRHDLFCNSHSHFINLL